MEAATCSAAIAAIGTVLGSILRVFTKDYLENRNFVFLNSACRKALNGIWTGEVIQNVNTLNERKHRVELEINTGWWRLYGTGKVFVDHSAMLTVNLKGAFRNDKFLKMSYENRRSEIVQFFYFFIGRPFDRPYWNVCGIWTPKR